MGFQRSIHSIALAAGIVVVTMSLACPMGLMLAHMGLITPPLMDISIGPVAISSQGETVYSSRRPLRTFYSVWLFVKPHTLHLLARVEIPNGGRPIRWRACSLAVRQTIVARCAPRRALRAAAQSALAPARMMRRYTSLYCTPEHYGPSTEGNCSDFPT